jgi:phosphoserine phosphatase
MKLSRLIRLVVFDLDGTLTTVDSLWRYLHDALGTWEQGRATAQRYENGEISYKEWAETDARFWAGASLRSVKRIISEIPYREGAEEVFSDLKKRGVKIVILSAGLSLLAEKIASNLGADLAIANELRTNDGRLTGEIDVKVAVNNKEQIVRQVVSRFSIPLRARARLSKQGMPEDRFLPER